MTKPPGWYIPPPPPSKRKRVINFVLKVVLFIGFLVGCYYLYKY